MKYLFCLCFSLMMTIGLARAEDYDNEDNNHDYAQAKFNDQNGESTGYVKFTQQKEGVVVEVHARNLKPGFHGFHIHAVGECLSPFTSAGGHFDRDGHTHKDHSGDLPVLLVNADGKAKAKFKTDRFRVADLFDADGSAVIIHASPDNYANIPTRYVATPDTATLATGDAGARIACGVVENEHER